MSEKTICAYCGKVIKGSVKAYLPSQEPAHKTCAWEVVAVSQGGVRWVDGKPKGGER